MRYLFILILFVINNYASSQGYIPLVKEGKYWIYNHYSHSSCFLMGWNSTELRYFSGDTIINSKSYKKLISSLATSQLPPYEISSKKTICYMREDTLLKKVFMVNLDDDVFPCVNSSNEILIWNFGIKAGDTLPDCLINIFNPVDFGDEKSFVLDSTNLISITSGQILKHFYYLGVPPGICGDLAQMPVNFIEGFGMEDGPIFKRYGTFLVAFCEGTLEQCNIISNTKDDEKESNSIQFVLIPNPSRDIIEIQTEIQIQKVEIFDQNGHIVLLSLEKKINVSHLLSGIYFMKCLGVNNKLYFSKFIKM